MSNVTLAPEIATPAPAATTGERDARPRWWTRLAVGLAAGVGASLVLGVTARLLMRAVALAAGAETGFTWLGTLMISVAFAMFVVPGAVVAALWLGRGRSLLLVLGGPAFCVPVTGTAMTDLGSAGDLTTLQWVGALAATGGIYLAALAIPVVTLPLIRRGLRRAAGR